MKYYKDLELPKGGSYVSRAVQWGGRRERIPRTPPTTRRALPPVPTRAHKDTQGTWRGKDKPRKQNTTTVGQRCESYAGRSGHMRQHAPGGKTRGPPGLNPRKRPITSNKGWAGWVQEFCKASGQWQMFSCADAVRRVTCAVRRVRLVCRTKCRSCQTSSVLARKP